MRRFQVAVLATALLALMITPVGADQDGVVRFATLPPGPGHPEGIAADASSVYAASLSFAPPNFIYIFDINSGRLKGTVTLPRSVPLGMYINGLGSLYVADFGNGEILRFTPPIRTGSTPSATYKICQPAPPTDCGLNAIVLDRAGNLYVSDSFGGKVYQLAAATGAVTVWAEDELLRPGSHAFPGFGANGLAFDSDQRNLYVANTGDDRILRVNVATRAVTVFAESVNGADGIAFDSLGRLWIAANQGDELVALDFRGRVVERRGAFEGIGPDGAPRGLLFPASIVIVRDDIYVTNAALALTQQAGDEPEEDARTFTVSRVPQVSKPRIRQEGR
jgi:DNA-binding beta-propeller fold protein YncE